jgi:thiamine-monophosphate kinase
MREADWLRRAAELFGARHPGVPVGVGDDCALLEPHGPMLISTDTVVDGVHFDHRLIDWSDIGWRALAVALSDLAACGADPTRPIAALLALQLPDEFPDDELMNFARGLGECARAHGCVIAGGDTVSTPGPFAATITVVGYTDRAVLRSAARVGDLVAVTGPLGEAAAGLHALQHPPAPANAADAIRAYRRPVALLAIGAKLAKAATAMIDISDGLVGDLDQLCRASGVGARLELEKLPLTAATRELLSRDRLDPLLTAATFGDDYQLLCCLHPTSLDWLCAEAPGLTVIGVITAGDHTVALRGGREVEFARRGYEHGRPPKEKT